MRRAKEKEKEKEKEKKKKNFTMIDITAQILKDLIV
jgi:hypothetical protein